MSDLRSSSEVSNEVQSGAAELSAVGYINSEGSLPVCDGLDDSNWDNSFFTQLKEPEEKTMTKAKKSRFHRR